jgi:hypothetical protein
MGPLLYSLCQKPLLGAAMASIALCDFPPLFKDLPMPLERAGATVTTDIDVPVELPYALQLEASHPGGEPLSKEEIAILGDERSDDCSQAPARKAAARPMAFKVQVLRRDDAQVVIERQVSSVCVAARWSNLRLRTLATLPLAPGAYQLRVENMEAQAGLERLKLTLLMVAPRP